MLVTVQTHRRASLIGVFCGLFSAIPATLGSLQAPVPTEKPWDIPAWWFGGNVIERLHRDEAQPMWPASYPAVDDHATVNAGHLKKIASAGGNELEDHLAGGAGREVRGLIPDLANPSDDYVPITVGKLKQVAKGFHVRLAAAGLASDQVLAGDEPDIEDSGVANFGHLKNLFGFDVSAVPTEVQATAASSTSIEISWTVGFSLQRFAIIHCSIDGGVTWQAIGTIGGSAGSFLDTNAPKGGKAMYYVRASYGSGFITKPSATVVVDFTLPPAAASDVQATQISPTAERITWRSNSNNIAYFKVMRTEDYENWVIVGTVPGNVTSFVDKDLPPGIPYFYKIRAGN